jgi:DNA repair photolyase
VFLRSEIFWAGSPILVDIGEQKANNQTMSAAPLIPISALTAKGIARAAFQGSTLAEKRRVDYKQLATKKWINRCEGKRAPFDWTINPYRGCEFGCVYCYARYTHEFLERHDQDAFETEIYVKEWDERSFLKEFSSVRRGDLIGIGTATDPYQPAERRFEKTREMLSIFSKLRGLRLNLISKSDLIIRDAALLSKVAENNELRVAITITTLNVDLARKLEPLAPRPDLRLQAVRTLAEAGVPVGVINSPLMPGINGSVEKIRQVAESAKEHGAQFFCAGLVFLKPSAKAVFLPFVAREFPEMRAWYETNFSQKAFLSAAVADKWKQAVRDIRADLNLDPEWWFQKPASAESPKLVHQGLLFC